MEIDLRIIPEPAQICRENGWIPGTVLTCNDGISLLWITAVGRSLVLGVFGRNGVWGQEETVYISSAYKVWIGGEVCS